MADERHDIAAPLERRAYVGFQLAALARKRPVIYLVAPAVLAEFNAKAVADLAVLFPNNADLGAVFARNKIAYFCRLRIARALTAAYIRNDIRALAVKHGHFYHPFVRLPCCPRNL